MKLSKYSLTTWLLAMWFIGSVACTTPNSALVDSELVPNATDTPISTAAAVTTEEAPPPVAPTPTPTLNLQIPPPQSEPTATAVPPSPTPRATVPTPTPVPTSDVVAGWLTYENTYFGYRFAYPPDARIRIQGVTGFSIEELPENMTVEAYLEQLQELYPDDLCVTVLYEEGFVVFVPVYDKEGKYTVPCGVTGVGDYDVVDVSEIVVIDGVPYTASGWKLYERGTDTWHGEFYFLEVSDTTTIHYGLTSGTHEVYLRVQQDMMQIVMSFRRIE